MKSTKLIAKVGRVSDESVRKGSGKHWHQWMAILERAGAHSWTHQEIVAFLKRKHKLSTWWQQGVTLGFELHTGRRVEGQSLKGDYSLTATRSIGLAAKDLWKRIWSDGGLQIWLQPMSPFEIEKGATYECEGGIFGEVRSFKKGERVRLTWQDTDWPKPTVLQVILIPRPGKKSIFVIQHDGFKSPAMREKMRAHWKAAIQRLAAEISN